MDETLHSIIRETLKPENANIRDELMIKKAVADEFLKIEHERAK